MTRQGFKPKDLMMTARALALQADGWWLRSEIVWAKPNPMPESVRDRPTSSHEKVFLLTKSATYFYDADAVKERRRETAGTAAASIGTRQFERMFLRRTVTTMAFELFRWWTTAGDASDVWHIATQPNPWAEGALGTFPTGKTWSKHVHQGGSRLLASVLDPFAGAGTTAWSLSGLDAVSRNLNQEMNFRSSGPVVFSEAPALI